MKAVDRRHGEVSDRRRAPRGGRRAFDRVGQCPTVLVADSYEPARAPCARYLEHFNFLVNQAADGREAMAHIHGRPPQVIIVEQHLPVMSARSLKQWLSLGRQTRRIPIIVTTNDFNIEIDPHSQGMEGLLAKPFSLATLINEVRRVLRARAARD